MYKGFKNFCPPKKPRGEWVEELIKKRGKGRYLKMILTITILNFYPSICLFGELLPLLH